MCGRLWPGLLVRAPCSEQVLSPGCSLVPALSILAKIKPKEKPRKQREDSQHRGLGERHRGRLSQAGVWGWSLGPSNSDGHGQGTSTLYSDRTSLKTGPPEGSGGGGGSPWLKYGGLAGSAGCRHVCLEATDCPDPPGPSHSVPGWPPQISEGRPRGAWKGVVLEPRKHTAHTLIYRCPLASSCPCLGVRGQGSVRPQLAGPETWELPRDVRSLCSRRDRRPLWAHGRAPGWQEGEEQ